MKLIIKWIELVSKFESLSKGERTHTRMHARTLTAMNFFSEIWDSNGDVSNIFRYNCIDALYGFRTTYIVHIYISLFFSPKNSILQLRNWVPFCLCDNMISKLNSIQIMFMEKKLNSQLRYCETWCHWLRSIHRKMWYRSELGCQNAI